MKTKICKKCGKRKKLSEFHKHKSTKSGYHHCKECQHIYYIKNRLYIILRMIKQRCENPKRKEYKYYGGKGIKCYLTLNDLKYLWNKNKGWLLKRPSIDRIDSNKHYKRDNCQFIELIENIKKGRSKTVYQYDLKGNFIAEYKSVMIAEKETNIPHQQICKVALHQRSQCHGFIWKYKSI